MIKQILENNDSGFVDMCGLFLGKLFLHWSNETL